MYLLSDMTGRHPAPDSDWILRVNGYRQFETNHHTSMRFGFESLDQLKRWIYDEEIRLALHNTGLVVNVYEVPFPYIIIGETQTVAVIDHMVLQYTLTLREI